MATYIGKLNNLVTGNDLYSLMDLSMGTNQVTGDITWLKFIVGEYQLLIADRCLKVSITPNDLNPKNAMQGKDISINGVTYQCRCLSRAEWTETIVTHTPDNADSNWKGIQTWTKDAKNEESYYVVGGGSVAGVDYWFNTSNRPTVGWRPVLIKLKELDKLPPNASLSSAVSNINEIKSRISSLSNTLKTNLTAKGVEVLPTDKMSNLIDKVVTITTGKKWAEGTVSNLENTSSSTYKECRVNVDLGFTPSHVVLHAKTLQIYGNIVASNVEINSKYANSESNYSAFVNYAGGNLYIYISNISSNGFSIFYKFSSGTTNKFEGLNWEAYE